MRMIDVLNMMAKGEIKEGTILTINDREIYRRYKYIGNCFLNDYNSPLNIYGESDLNSEVELIPPKEKKYLIKVNIQGLHEDFAYLNYGWFGSCVTLNSRVGTKSTITHFTKDELQSIQPVREFIESMKDKYELIEVEENEND